jgi:hypothetical protein
MFDTTELQKRIEFSLVIGKSMKTRIRMKCKACGIKERLIIQEGSVLDGNEYGHDNENFTIKCSC